MTNRFEARSFTWSICEFARKELCDIIDSIPGKKGLVFDSAISVGEYHLDGIPLDSDLVSMEIERCFGDLYGTGDYSLLQPLCNVLMRLQTLHGYFPRVIGKGQYAKLLADMLNRRKDEFERGMLMEENFTMPEYDELIILDRNVDLISPLLTQLTYEGLIDECFGIDHSVVELEPVVSGYKEKRKVPLNDSDPVFKLIRNMSFSSIGPVLSNTAKQLQKNYDERHQAQSVAALREFIGKLGNLQQEHQSLQLRIPPLVSHYTLSFSDINVRDWIFKNFLTDEFHEMLEFEQNLMIGEDTSKLLTHIESWLFRGDVPIERVLRYLCLASVVSGGLKQKQWDHFRQELLHTYGYHYLTSLNTLVHSGLLKVLPNNAAVKSPMLTFGKQLRLKVDDVNDQNPGDFAYVHAVIAPLSVRIIEKLIKNQEGGSGELQTVRSYLSSSPPSSPSVWRGMEESLNLLPGPTFDLNVKVPILEAIDTKQDRAIPHRRRIVVVYIGGCTMAEVASLRWLVENSQDQLEIMIVTTRILNASNLLRSFLPTQKDFISLSGKQIPLHSN